MKEECAVCCAVYSVIGVVLMLFFGAMFNFGASTMLLIAAKRQWDPVDKANACFRAAIWYGVTLFISVLAKIYFAKSRASEKSGLAGRGVKREAL